MFYNKEIDFYKGNTVMTMMLLPLFGEIGFYSNDWRVEFHETFKTYDEAAAFLMGKGFFPRGAEEQRAAA